MKFVAVLFFITILTSACSNKKEADKATTFFPVHSFLQSQIKHIDTSLYALRKVTKAAGQSDTTFLHRDAFRAEAVDFIALPDIASDDLKEDYNESRMYDDVLKRAVFSYTPKENDAEILRQDVTIEPGAGGDDAVRTIFVNQLKNGSDSTVQKKLLWEVGKRFQAITTVSKKGAPDATRVVEVWWAAPAE